MSAVETVIILALMGWLLTAHPEAFLRGRVIPHSDAADERKKLLREMGYLLYFIAAVVAIVAFVWAMARKIES